MSVSIRVFGIIVALLSLLGVQGLTAPVAGAAKKTKFGKGPISVRLCPARCVEVRGLGYRGGGNVTVYENRSGWSRVSPYIDPTELSGFGSKVPPKPAYWVRSRQIIDPVVDNPAKEAAPAVTETAVVPAKKPKAAAAKKKRAVRSAGPANKRKVTLPSFRPGTSFDVAAVATGNQAEAPDVVETNKPKTDQPAPEGEEKMVEAEPVAGTKPVAAKAVENEIIPTQKTDIEKVVTKVEPAKAEASANTQTLTEADKFVAPKELEDAAADAAMSSEIETEKPKPAVKEPGTAIAGAETEQASEPKKDVSPEAKPEQKPTQAQPAEKVEVAAVEPSITATGITPLTTAERPKKYTKALRDRRLRKLPGSKNKAYKLEEVIALRHYALTLLTNKECSGISGGGRSVGQAGMLYVVCTNDPTYLRQFPLEEQIW